MPTFHKQPVHFPHQPKSYSYQAITVHTHQQELQAKVPDKCLLNQPEVVPHPLDFHPLLFLFHPMSSSKIKMLQLEVSNYNAYSKR